MAVLAFGWAYQPQQSSPTRAAVVFDQQARHGDQPRPTERRQVLRILGVPRWWPRSAHFVFFGVFPAQMIAAAIGWWVAADGAG